MNSAESERAAIVAWLRETAELCHAVDLHDYGVSGNTLECAADHIERGLHIKDTVLSEGE